jgi:hypothetical protein
MSAWRCSPHRYPHPPLLALSDASAGGCNRLCYTFWLLSMRHPDRLLPLTDARDVCLCFASLCCRWNASAAQFATAALCDFILTITGLSGPYVWDESQKMAHRHPKMCSRGVTANVATGVATDAAGVNHAWLGTGGPLRKCHGLLCACASRHNLGQGQGGGQGCVCRL